MADDCVYTLCTLLHRMEFAEVPMYNYNYKVFYMVMLTMDKLLINIEKAAYGAHNKYHDIKTCKYIYNILFYPP